MEYSEEIKIKNTIKLRAMLNSLPKFVSEFFRGVADKTSFRTRTSYAFDFKLFFDYICGIKNKTVSDFSIDDLNTVTTEEIESFMEYITLYEKERDGKVIRFKNDEKGKARKLSSLRSLFQYFYKKRKLNSNPASLIDLPKLHEKAIIRLEVDEVSKLLDEVESGNKLTVRQSKFHQKTKVRDFAIITLLLGTGMRISECVGINIDDINFETNGIKITRKGGNESIIYFGDEVRYSLLDYLKQRRKIIANEGYEQAFFLSLHKRRITDRAIQNLVKKYAKIVTPLKKISPHKLRSTYGTNLYRETGDIYLVADVLGHKDINTTKKHYASMSEDRRKMAAKVIKLREN